jgi:hypothetical protein
MPAPAQLTAVLIQVRGKVTGLSATANANMLALGIGGSVQVDGVQFLCPTAFTAAMLTVAADARQAGVDVSVQCWDVNSVIDSISSS